MTQSTSIIVLLHTISHFASSRSSLGPVFLWHRILKPSRDSYIEVLLVITNSYTHSHIHHARHHAGNPPWDVPLCLHSIRAPPWVILPPPSWPSPKKENKALPVVVAILCERFYLPNSSESEHKTKQSGCEFFVRVCLSLFDRKHRTKDHTKRKTMPQKRTKQTFKKHGNSNNKKKWMVMMETLASPLSTRPVARSTMNMSRFEKEDKESIS